jgi:hypothetical protein
MEAVWFNCWQRFVFLSFLLSIWIQSSTSCFHLKKLHAARIYVSHTSFVIFAYDFCSLKLVKFEIMLFCDGVTMLYLEKFSPLWKPKATLSGFLSSKKPFLVK